MIDLTGGWYTAVNYQVQKGALVWLVVSYILFSKFLPQSLSSVTVVCSSCVQMHVDTLSAVSIGCHEHSCFDVEALGALQVRKP